MLMIIEKDKLRYSRLSRQNLPFYTETAACHQMQGQKRKPYRSSLIEFAEGRQLR
jgi:hypothetical protein